MTKTQFVQFCAASVGKEHAVVLKFLTDEANYQKEVNARVAALDRTYVVGITASFRRDDLSREDQAAWVASEFGAYAYVVAMPAGDRNPWSSRQARQRL